MALGQGKARRSAESWPSRLAPCLRRLPHASRLADTAADAPRLVLVLLGQRQELAIPEARRRNCSAADREHARACGRTDARTHHMLNSAPPPPRSRSAGAAPSTCGRARRFSAIALPSTVHTGGVLDAMDARACCLSVTGHKTGRIPNGSFRLKFSPEVLVGYQNFRPPTCSIARTTEVRVRCKL